MPTSPYTSKTDLPSYRILIEGTQLKDELAVLSIRVECNLFEVSKARIVLSDGDADQESFELSENADFNPGKEIEIKLGYHSDDKTVFKGVIVKHDIRVRAYRNKVVSEMIIDCYDKAFEIDVVRNSACFLKKTDSDVISEVVGNYGLTCSCAKTTIEHDWLIQHDCTDWDFVNMRAQAIGMVVINKDGKITIEKPDFGSSPELIVMHSEVESFQAGIDASKQALSASFEAWDPKTQKYEKGESKEPSLNKMGTDTGKKMAEAAGSQEISYKFSVLESKDSLNNLADARLLTHRLALFNGHCKFIGSEKVALGKLISFKGFGKRFDGDAYISGYFHEVREGRWFTSVKFGLPPIPYDQQSAYKLKAKTSTGMPDIKGLHIGTVKQIDKDEANEFRVMVLLGTLGEQEGALIWARLLQPYASKEAGFFFYPEIGDEVLVGFLGNDPRNAIIMGGLYSSKNVPPFPVNKDNNRKGIQTPKKLIFSMDDKDGIISLETTGGHKVTLTDKEKEITLNDLNGNTISMGADGITIKSPKKIILDATQDIQISSSTNIDIKATSDLKMKGLNVEASADASLKAKGTASAEFSAAGQTTVKGAMVQIN